jgi:hypothetical protein
VFKNRQSALASDFDIELLDHPNDSSDLNKLSPLLPKASYLSKTFIIIVNRSFHDDQHHHSVERNLQ